MPAMPFRYAENPKIPVIDTIHATNQNQLPQRQKRRGVRSWPEFDAEPAGSGVFMGGIYLNAR